MLAATKELVSKYRTSAFQLVKVFLDQGLSSFASFVAGMLLARSCGKEDYAIYVLAFSIIYSVLGLQRALISMPYSICRNDFSDGVARRYRIAIFWFRRCFVLSLLLAALGSWLIAILLHTAPDWRIWGIIFLALCGQTYYFFVKDVLMGELRVGTYLCLGVMTNLVLLSGIFLLFFLNELSVIYYFILLAGSGLLFSAIFERWCFRGNSKRPKRKEMRFFFHANWRIGKWALGSNILFTISLQAYPWILAAFSGDKAVAVFGVVTGVSRFFNPLFQGINAYFLPKMSSLVNNRRMFRNCLIMLTSVLATVGVFLALVGFFYGEELVVLLYSKKYAGLGFPAFLALVEQGLLLLLTAFEIAINALKRSDIIFKNQILRMSVTLTAGLYLGISYAVPGVLLALILEKVIVFAYLLYGLHSVWRKGFSHTTSVTH